MRIFVEISFYPLTKDYKGPIRDFISRLHFDESLEVETNRMSTQIKGEHDRIFALLSKEIEAEFQKHRASFIIKVIKGKD